MIICLARMERKTTATGYPYGKATAHALIWCNREKPFDLDNAHKHAKKYKYTVICLPESTRDPLAEAKQIVNEIGE